MREPCILFVDDEPAVLDALRRMLRRQAEAWRLRFAPGAAQALAEVREREVDVVVTDVNMPEKDGLHLLDELRNAPETAGIPVVILTGNHDQDLKRRALDRGADDLLSKPVRIEDLLARLRSTLRLKAARDELKRQNAMLEQRVNARTAELEQSRLDIIWRLATAAEFRDEDTGNHVIRVGCYSRALAAMLGADAEFQKLIFLASPLHDIGKIGIPDEILLKPGQFTPRERAIMQGHCRIGAQILEQDSKLAHVFESLTAMHAPQANNPLLHLAATIALAHHERWDGEGYPNRISRDEIPLAARIVGLADVYDALCSRRPYKPALPEEQVFETIRREAGRHFDPAVVRAFERAREDFQAVRAELSDPELALLEKPG